MTDTAKYDHLLEVLKKRRTNRRFKSDPIAPGQIEKIIEAARWSPSGFHTQPWEFVAVTRKDVRDKIVAALDRHSPPLTDPNAPRNASRASFRDAPVFIITLCDWRAYVGLPGNPEADSPRVVRTFYSSMASAFRPSPSSNNFFLPIRAASSPPGTLKTAKAMKTKKDRKVAVKLLISY